MRVALVGMKMLSEPDHDEAPLLRALWESGIDAQALHWDDPTHDPGDFDVCVLRATWNYHLEPEAFVRWLTRADERTRVVNPVQAVRWNMHKRYLLELERAGVPIIPTCLVERGSAAQVNSILGEYGWSKVVIKPAVSAASWKTRCFEIDEISQAEVFLREAVAQRDMLVQPYMDAVDRGGEVSIIWISGEVTHAIRKRPRFDGEDEQVQLVSAVSSSMQEFAQRAIGASGQDVTYARIDVVEDADGRLRLSELEFIEPSLYFPQCEVALARMVQALARHHG